MGKRPMDKVQDVGFRGLIEALGRVHSLSGMVFNYPDGSVMVYCSGDNRTISNFFKEIQIKATERGIVFDIINKKELPPDCRLPVEFLRLDTDDKIDLSRKLDRGIEILSDIKGDTSDMKMGIHDLNTKFDSYAMRLEKILEKLADR